MAGGLRVSTAGRTQNSYLIQKVEQLPPGCLLNLGAGAVGVRRNNATVVNVDHVQPLSPSLAVFVVADASALPFKAAAFDGVLAKDVLEHVPDPVGVLTELRRVVPLRAALILTVPRAIPRAVWDDPTHVRGFTQRALRTALRLSGWLDTMPVRRIGSIPGIARLGLTQNLEAILRIPLFGHWFGTNWLVETHATSAQVSSPPSRSSRK